MPDFKTLHTDDLDARDRAGQWREWVWRHFGGLESDFYGDSGFEGGLASSRAGEVVLTRLQANRHRVLRPAGPARGGEGDYLKIVAPLQGRAGVEQGARQAWVGEGGWAIYDTTRAYRVDSPERSDHLIVMLPRARMALGGARLDTLMARQSLGGRGISRVALEAMRRIYQELPCMGEDAARGAGELVLHLVRLSLQELAGAPTPEARREDLRDRIRRHVLLHLREPALDAAAIARALGCSRRALYSAFEGEACTPAGYIQQQRLQACERALADPRQSRRSITEVALEWGFASSAHFSRVFRARTGMSPSDYRAAQAPARR